MEKKNSARMDSRFMELAVSL